MRLAIAAGALLIGASAHAEPQRLDMTAFFTGRSHAENVLKIALQGPKTLIVDSVGRTQGKEFILVDTVREQGKPVRMRQWAMHATGPGRYAGTLSDAVGPVNVAVSGGQAVIRYKMKGGLNVVQQLQLQPDGRSLANRVVVRKFGLKFASVEGTIRKLD